MKINLKKIVSLVLCTVLLSPVLTENTFASENTEVSQQPDYSGNSKMDNPVNAKEEQSSYSNSILSYYQDKELIVNNGLNYGEVSADLAQIADLDNFTLTMKLKTTSTSLQSLFFVGSDQPGTGDKYFNFYVWGDKLGIEIRDGSLNPTINAPVQNFTDGSWHIVTLNYSRNKFYRIYADGKKILENTDSAVISRFLDSLGMTPDTMTFGKGTRAAGNNYPYTGSIKDAAIYAESLNEDEILVQHGIIDGLEPGTVISEKELPFFDGNSQYDISDKKEILQSLTQGSVNIRFRVKDFSNSNNGLMSLFSVSNKTVDDTYGSFYINPGSNRIGIELKSGGTVLINAAASIPDTCSIQNNEWHTASFVVNKTLDKYFLYVDGVLCGSGPVNGFIADIQGIDTVRIGDLSRSRGDHLWVFKGDIDLADIYADPLSETNIMDLHDITIRKQEQVELPETAVKSEPVSLFYQNYDNSSSYRIPSLLTTKNGVVIAAIDKRQSGSADAGNIDIAVRRSLNNGDTWENPQVILNLPDGKNRSSFVIDSSMVEDEETGEIHLLVDMFPESMGLMEYYNPPLLDGSGYRTVNGKRYLELRDYYSVNDGENCNVPATDRIFTRREDGSVYLENSDGTSTLTDYTVPNFSDGKLYKDGVAAGNIFLYTGDDAGELKIKRTTYLWMVTSKDDGTTWSEPVDLTGQVKAEWMRFMGTGPGVGIQIKNGPNKGRLVFPVYHTNSKIGSSQCSAVIYSDDHGLTWTCGESPNQLRGFNPETMNNSSNMLTESQVVEVGTQGRIKIFMRNYGGKVSTATSDDGGATWSSFKKDEALFDSYCQLSVVKYNKQLEYEGVLRDAYIFSNPASEGRNNGTVRIGFYDEEKDEFIWSYRQMVHEGKYQYSCLSVLPDGQIGLFYEGDVPNMRFTKFTDEWVTAPRYQEMGIPTITNIQMERQENKLLFTVDFDQYMLKTGIPFLKINIDGKEGRADYKAGASTKQYIFEYALQDPDAQKIAVINVSGDENSEIGNIKNKFPEDVNYEFDLQK